MDEKKLVVHSWGEFYDTLKEMKENGDTSESEQIRRIFELINKLENAKNLQEVKEVINFYNLTEIEINYINSRCLDGIIATINKEDPGLELIEKIPHVDTFLFYYEREGFQESTYKNRYGEQDTTLIVRKLSDRYLGLLCKNGCTEILKIIVSQDDLRIKEHFPVNLPITFLDEVPCVLHTTIHEFLAVFGQEKTLQEILLILKGKMSEENFCMQVSDCYYYACKYKRENVTKMLLTEYLSLEAEHYFSEACENLSVNFIKYMIDTYKIDIHYNDEDPVFKAAWANNKEVVNFLLSKGASERASKDGYHENYMWGYF